MANKRPSVIKGQVYADRQYNDYHREHIDYASGHNWDEENKWVYDSMYHIIVDTNSRWIQILTIFIMRRYITGEKRIWATEQSRRSSKSSMYSYTGSDIQLVNNDEEIQMLKGLFNDMFLIDDTYVKD